MRAASVEETTSRRADPGDEVRAFYESHPYPAPLANLDRHRELKWIAANSADHFLVRVGQRA